MLVVKKYVVFISLMVLGIFISGQLNGQNLKDHRWKHRIVIVQTSDPLSASYLSQLKEFNGAQEELKERKLLIYQVEGLKYRIFQFSKRNIDKAWTAIDDSATYRLKGGETFRVILIGLDGGVKLETTKLLEKSELFRIIDAMPMRISEKRNGN